MSLETADPPEALTRKELPPDSDLPRLVGAAQAGDRQAFGDLYTHYAGLVYSIAASLVSVDEAADVVQEVFLRALRKLKGLREPTAFRAWIAAIARNAARDLQSQMRLFIDSQHEPVRRETQHDELAARVALRAIRALPMAYRRTVRMRLVEGMTGPEIAERTGLSAASVRVNLHRGIKLLRERLAASSRRPASPAPRGRHSRSRLRCRHRGGEARNVRRA